MVVTGEHESKKFSFSKWVFLPVEQAAVLGLLLLAAPGAWAVYLLSQYHVLSGGILLSVWLAGMGALGSWAHRRRYVHLWVTGMLVATVLIACIVVLASTGAT